MKVCIIGASGYTGAELARLVNNHPQFELEQLCVSENSADANKRLSELYPALQGCVDFPLIPIGMPDLTQLSNDFDIIFLATPHEASHDWVGTLLQGRAKVFDLSGAFRLQDRQVFEHHYGFPHAHPNTLCKAVYGLAEWYASDIARASLIAVPGCYPTASLLATKPLMQAELLDAAHYPIINAVSGVSGAGRKAALNTSFCEVSLQAYGILSHRHTPEISAYLGSPVIFTPHLGNFKRGILATVTCKLKYGVTEAQVNDAFSQAYQQSSLVRLRTQAPKIDDVVHQAFADIHWQYSAQNGYVVISCAIDNLLKGAASQAMQCANLVFGLPDWVGLVAHQGGHHE
ncbi:N-acetyl-gamma-glutamyl-phosphate reductase [Alteromonas flava]|uniref:N-acetyl-gamma-glutamyl-phosphate reductase n=1 Tax=Alteromonas flava TaxID=2048003 RepID=UPI000C2847DD|nr:N-acetyl-gamma-glutamyl-phosphate reductase [Alteromonas flava]